MEVILNQDFPALGYVGDRVSVKPGYARNFLLPRGIAVEALSRNAKLLKHRMAGITAKRLKLKAEAETVAGRFAGIVLEFTLKMSGQGRSFGSITLKDIQDSLKDKGLVVDRKQIRLLDSLKRAGSYEAFVKLHSEVQLPITLRILAEKSAIDKSAAPKKGKRGKKGAEEEGAVETSEAEDSGQESESTSSPE